MGGLEKAMKAVRVSREWEKAGVYYVRTETMVFGFDVSLEGEFQDDGAGSFYVLVTDDKGKPLSTCRLHPVPETGFAKIERVATISAARGQGAGRLGISEAESWARELGYSHIVITSRREVTGFYESLGYVVREDMNPETLKPKTPEDPVVENPDPRFICVYMEKQLPDPALQP